MTTATEFQTKVDKSSINMDRFDKILNGDEDTVVEVDGGLMVPSFANVQKAAAVEVEGAAAAAALAGHYANDADNVDIPGGAPGDRGAKFFAAQSMAAASALNVGIDAALDATRNLFDKTRTTIGFLNSDGSINNNTNFYTSDFIMIQPGGQITANVAIVASGSGYIVFYDASRSRVASIQNGGSDVAAGSPISAPATSSIRFVRVSIALSSSARGGVTIARGASALQFYQSFGMVDRYTSMMRIRAALLAEMPGRNIAVAGAITAGQLYNVNTASYAAVGGYYSTRVPVPAGQQVTIANAIAFNSEYGVAFLDIDGVQISKYNSPIAAGTTYAVPSGAAYLEVPSANGALVEVYVGTSVPAVRSSGPLLDAGAAAGLSAGLMFAALPAGTNLFDPARCTTSAYRDRQSGAVVSNPACAFTHNMPCQPGQPVIFSAGNSFSISAAGLAWLDRNGVIIGSIAPPLVGGQTYMPPNNAAYWFCNFPLSALPRPFFGIGSALPVGYRGSGNADASLVKAWANKAWAMSGDSIVAQNMWAPLVRDYMRVASYTNWGVSGSKMADVLTNRSSNDFTNLDVYGISSGTNDFGAQTPIGSSSDGPNAATFWGAMLKNYNTILGYKPTLRYFMMSPLHRGDEFTAFTSGISLKAYRDAEMEFCTLYGVPIYDQYSRSGIGPATFQTYMTQNDGFNNLHPNSVGGRLIGRQLAPWIEGLGCADTIAA